MDLLAASALMARHKAIESVMFARRKRWLDRIMKTNKQRGRNERLSAEGCYRGRGLYQADCAELPTLGGLMR
jgi:hypothetical protein